MYTLSKNLKTLKRKILALLYGGYCNLENTCSYIKHIFVRQRAPWVYACIAILVGVLMYLVLKHKTRYLGSKQLNPVPHKNNITKAGLLTAGLATFITVVVHLGTPLLVGLWYTYKT